ncbi:inorganic phosphate transporter [Flavobacteriaceae bacterium]|nr:inorganic phosphate transporter [Flavobacteriaceae bacterium]
MNDVYILMVIALAVLAAIDLVVGVSNDAVNFLNSAIGSKAIPIKKIMIIASLGVLAGALSSSGMMEVARKGIFVPAQFHFDEIMYIFMAVMITDIILLDIFNTLGMPTSTTVSIVFELLGAAVTISLIKILGSETETLNDIWNYINYETALTIIIGILLSVFVAFSIGAIVQFASRLVYSFDFEKRPNYINAIFGGLSISAITYFIIVKGLKGTSFYGEIKHIIDENNFELILVSFLFWSAISYFFVSVLKFNILKIIIGIGTFSLAMAFAGNDLVNFIGVPIAAWNSYEAWSVSGIPADEFSMGILAKKVPSNNFLLIVAGTIMVVTLWFSKKARLVIETGVNLSRQGEGHEKFNPNSASRGLVRTGIVINNAFRKVTSEKTLSYIDNKFEKKEIDFGQTEIKDIPAFDMVRAAINLVVAGILISIGTSLKLPLSTTYVTFMVAMGTSLADRAWGRESAVYRIAGVLSVIGGWFLTAFVAFTASAIVAYLIYLGGIVTVSILLILIFVLLGKHYLKSAEEEKEKELKFSLEKETIDTISGVIEDSSEKILSVTKRARKLYSFVIESLIDENLDNLRKNDKSVKKLNADVEDLRSDVFYFIKSLEETSVTASKFYIVALEYIQDVVQSVEYISKISFKHVNNNHKKLKKDQITDLVKTEQELHSIFKLMQDFFETNDFEKLGDLLDKKQYLLGNVSKSVEIQINRIRTTETSAKNSTLYFGIILETKDLITALINLSQHYQNFYTDLQSIEEHKE